MPGGDLIVAPVFCSKQRLCLIQEIIAQSLKDTPVGGHGEAVLDDVFRVPLSFLVLPYQISRALDVTGQSGPWRSTHGRDRALIPRGVRRKATGTDAAWRVSIRVARPRTIPAL